MQIAYSEVNTGETKTINVGKSTVELKIGGHFFRVREESSMSPVLSLATLDQLEVIPRAANAVYIHTSYGK